jgi:hypothetical protein
VGGGGFLKRGRFLPGHDMRTTRLEISATAVEHLGPGLGPPDQCLLRVT